VGSSIARILLIVNPNDNQHDSFRASPVSALVRIDPRTTGTHQRWFTVRARH